MPAIKLEQSITLLEKHFDLTHIDKKSMRNIDKILHEDYASDGELSNALEDYINTQAPTEILDIFLLNQHLYELTSAINACAKLAQQHPGIGMPATVFTQMEDPTDADIERYIGVSVAQSEILTHLLSNSKAGRTHILIAHLVSLWSSGIITYDTCLGWIKEYMISEKLDVNTVWHRIADFTQVFHNLSQLTGPTESDTIH